VLSKLSEFEWANKLNSMARQASAERAWQSINRFYGNCKPKKPGKKGFPRFKKNTRSVEYKTSGWKLSDDRKSIAFTDGFEAGKFELWGTRDLNFYQLAQIKRVRVVKRADGHYAQFCVDVEREIKHEYTGKIVGIDLGLEYFYADSDGQTVANPRRLRKSEKRLKRLQKRVSRRRKGSANRKKAINKMARQHLKVSRQRKDHAVKTAGALVASNDLIAYENLQVRNMVKNHKLAKSISDASWSMFVGWVEYFAKLHKIVTVAVPSQYTSQDCSGCGERVKKTLSSLSHQCLKCGVKMHRDHNAAQNILVKGLEVLGHKQSTDGQSGTHAWDECCGREYSLPQTLGENHLWSIEGNFGWVSGLVEPGNPRGDSWESPTIFGTPN